jgi:hypothetical protein
MPCSPQSSSVVASHGKSIVQDRCSTEIKAESCHRTHEASRINWYAHGCVDYWTRPLKPEWRQSGLLGWKGLGHCMCGFGTFQAFIHCFTHLLWRTTSFSLLDYWVISEIMVFRAQA